MDLVSRGILWGIIKRIKSEERTIIMMTRNYDEAEILSDRIAIISEGQILSIGSTVDFKKENGLGYQLNIYRR